MVREDEKQQGLERGEALIRTVPPEWLGGFFSAGGSLHFEIKTDKKPYGEYQYANPRVSVGGNDVDQLEVLKGMLGGGVFESKNKKRSEVSHYWILSINDLVVCLAGHMQGFVPSWEGKIKDFLEWEQSSIARRVEIAQQSSSNNGESSVVTSNYLSLVRIPDFLAGVIDGRACIYKNGSGNNRLEVQSINGALIEALISVYGGGFDYGTTTGDVIERRGREPFVIKQTSYIWKVGANLYRQLAVDPDLNLNSHLKLLQL